MNDIRFTNTFGIPRLIVLMEDKNWQFLDTIFSYIYEALDEGKSVSITIEKNEKQESNAGATQIATLNRVSMFD
jgi:hypothetical protein